MEKKRDAEQKKEDILSHNKGKWRRKQMLNRKRCGEPEHREMERKTDVEQKRRGCTEPQYREMEKKADAVQNMM